MSGRGGVLTNFPDGFAYGVTMRGIPLMQTNPGNVFWVGNGTTLIPNNASGANGNPGTFQRPFSTVLYALSQCQANTGDIILVKPGHAETIADAATLIFNKAGVAIIGMGSGSNRPTLTFSTSATANIPITAANMSLQNFLFKANVADVTSVFTATSTNTPTDLTIDMCEFRDGSAGLNFLSVITGNATANSMDGLYFSRNRVKSLGTTAATTAIVLASDTDRIDILDNQGVGAVLNDTAAVLAAGTAQLTSFFIMRNRWERPNTSSTGGSFVSGSGNAWTGMAADNYFYQADGSAGIWIATGHGLAFGYQNNYSPITGAAEKSGLINPVAA